MNALAIDSRDWAEAVPLSDHEALSRLVEYARAEALQIGEVVCAEFLAAALVALAAPTPGGAPSGVQSAPPNWL